MLKQTLKLGEIDFTKQPIKPELFVCKSNKQTISKIKNAYEIKYSHKLSAINALEFKIPTKIERNHILIDNPLLETIKHRYLFKMILGTHTEYFLFDEKNKSYETHEEYVHYHAFSLGFQLNDKMIRGYEEKSLNLEEHLVIILEETNWVTGYIDSEFITKYRAYNAGELTVLQCVYELAEKFNAVIEFDTVNKRLNFHRPDNIGLNKGFKVKERRYLESLNQIENSQEVITRLRLHGNEGLSIRSISPTGVDYIEDFSYYMYPYKEKRNYSTVLFNVTEIINWQNILDNLAVDIEESVLKLKSLDGKIAGKISNIQDVSMNYKITTSVKINEETSFGFLVGYKDINEYYRIVYDIGSTYSLRIDKVNNGVVKNLLKVHKSNLPDWRLSDFQEVELEVYNDDIRIWIDNLLVANVKDHDFIEGNFGLFVMDKEVFFKEISFNDKTHTVLQHSYHMSDDLCHAIIDQKELIKKYETDFNYYLEQRGILEEIVQDKENELAALLAELKIIWDELDIANAHGDKNGTDTSSIVRRKDEKQRQINEKETEILSYTNQISSIEEDIKRIQTKLAAENNYTPEQLFYLNDFIIVKDYTNDTIIDVEDLLKEGLEAFKKFREPKISLKINIVNFLEMVDCQHDWDKLSIGDTIIVSLERLGVNTSAKIIEINYDFEEKEIVLTIANEKEIRDTDQQFRDLLAAGNKANTQIILDKYKWDLSLENNGTINKIINNIWDATKQAVEAGYEQLIEINERGIIVRSPDDPDTYLVIQNGTIAITNDGGNTWKHSINSEGIVGERIYGKIISGVNLAIEDIDGIIKFRGSKGQIFDRNGTEVMKLGLVSEPPEPDCFGMILQNDITQVKMTDCEGIAITKRKLDNWEKILWADPSDGTLYLRDVVAERLKIVDDIGREILNAETGRFDIGWFKEIIADGKLTSLEKLRIYKEVSEIQSYYTSLVNQANQFRYSSRDNNINYDVQNPEETVTQGSLVHVDTSRLTESYNSLILYISNYIPVPPSLDEELMKRTDEIERDEFITKFKNFYDEAQIVRNQIENYLAYSGLQFGMFYNNLIFDSKVGFMAIRSDKMYRTFLNATHGIAIQKWENGQWANKLYGDLDGTLTAEDMVTKRLRIVDGNLGEKIILDNNDGITINGNNGEQIRLNANEGIAIDVNSDKRFWVGKDGNLYARKLIVSPDNPDDLIELPDGSFISDLTVNSLRSLNSINPQNYVFVQDDFIKLIYGDGKDDYTKFKLELIDTVPERDSYPMITWGVGSQYSDGNTNIAYQYKTKEGFFFDYISETGQMRKFAMTTNTTDSILLQTSHQMRLSAGQKLRLEVNSSNYIEITPNGVKVVGSRIDLN